MAKMNPVTFASAGSTPPEALSKGGLNETIPPEQRTPDARSELGAGPVIGERGEHKPALYPVRSGTREDR